VLGCTAIAILPQGMSRERFEWLKQIGAEIIATPGCESNVKEIYDKCWELKKDPANVIFNQFEEFGNPIFHYNVTGPRDSRKCFRNELGRTRALRARRLHFRDRLSRHHRGGRLPQEAHPALKIVATEALQCPTLLMNGFGDHRIEGIGDKHVPWVHNVRNTDAWRPLTTRIA
jgi:cysteine synthase A